MRLALTLLATGLILVSMTPVSHADWLRFRGPNGSGVAADTMLPTVWGEKQNLAWKKKLPGPGSSSPIVVGDRVFVTCYTGYGTGGTEDKQQNLKRRLMCFESNTGKLLWSKGVAAVLPEDNYRGFITHHGYASHTPASDGKNIYCFFGKTGVVAFDLSGKQLWHVSVGTGSNRRGWGTGASPIVYKNLVIVNASLESQSLIALDKNSGKQVWKAPELTNSWCTPVIADTKSGPKELVITYPDGVWGLDPQTGKELWTADVGVGSFPIPAVITHGEVVYVAGGRGKGGGAVAAIRTGGRGDVTKSHVLWQSREYSPVPTPVLYQSRLYCLNDSGFAFCVDALTGKKIYRARIAGGGAGGNRSTYASMVVAGSKLYAVSRSAGTFVLAPGDIYKKLSLNSFATDDSDFNATPAISGGQMFLRSNQYIYCVQGTRKPG